VLRVSEGPERRDVDFRVAGTRCAGWLYLPTQAAGEAPCVVMAHGTTGTKDFGLPSYAARFAGRGSPFWPSTTTAISVRARVSRAS
jgi:fermentation-respiration switch protein FrsA (DUF1100 family)